jgi:hypothetical protein
MRRGILFFFIFLLLLLAPLAWRYAGQNALTASLTSLRQPPPPVYDVIGVAERVPTPPAGAFVDEPEPGKGGLILLDRAHNNNFTLEELSYLDGRLAARGYELIPFQGGDLEGALRSVDAFVVIAPLSRFSRDEAQAVADFVRHGGRLLLVGDPTRFSLRFEENDFSFSFHLDSARLPLNSLARQFGVVFNGDFLYNTVENEGNFRNILLRAGSFAEHPLTDELDKLVFYAAQSISVVPGGQALLNGDQNTWSSTTDRPGGLTVAALGGNGDVLALGDFTFLTEPYHTVHDNARFIARIADFLAGSQRQMRLADFPYFYGPAVNLIYTGEPDLGADAFDEIIALQAAFRRVGKQLSLAGAAVEDYDTLYVGLYNQAEDVGEILAAYGYQLVIEPPILTGEEEQKGRDEVKEEAAADNAQANDEEKVLRQIVSPLGRVQMSGTALILLDESNGRRNLVVLAASKGGLEKTIDRLLDLVPLNAGYTLVDCFLQGPVALCPTNVANEDVEAELETGGAPERRPDPPAPGPGNGDNGSRVDEIDADLQGDISLGETVQATLPAGVAHAWIFRDGPARIDIIVEAGSDLDTVLEFFGPDLELIHRVDRTFTGGEEILAAVDVPGDEDYTIVVRDFFDEGGDYTLTVREAQADELDAVEQGEISAGIPVTGTLAEGEAHAWSFASEGATSLSILAMGEDHIDLVLELYDPDNFLIAHIDERLGGEPEIVEELEIGGGRYTLVIYDYFGEAGEYGLIVQLSEAALDLPLPVMARAEQTAHSSYKERVSHNIRSVRLTPYLRYETT